MSNPIRAALGVCAMAPLAWAATDIFLPSVAVAQPSGAGLCQPGHKVEYASSGRRFPGEVRGNDGSKCQVYAKAYMGVIDVAYSDLRADGGAPESGKPDLAAAGPALATTPREIVDAFERSPVAAKARYLNRRVRVTGSIFTIRSDSLWLKANLYQTAAVCMIEPGDRAPLLSLKEGVQITVEGTASDRGNESIFLQGCRLVGRGAAPVPLASPDRPMNGRYFCRSAGRGIGYVSLAGTSYTVDGVSGAMRYDPARRRLTFASGSYAKWGWSGEWRTDPDGIGGPPEPRIVLTDGKGLRVTCTPQP